MRAPLLAVALLCLGFAGCTKPLAPDEVRTLLSKKRIDLLDVNATERGVGFSAMCPPNSTGPMPRLIVGTSVYRAQEAKGDLGALASWIDIYVDSTCHQEQTAEERAHLAERIAGPK